MKSSDFLSVNGWLAFVFCVMLFFSFYYVWLYSPLDSQYNKQFWSGASTPSDEPLIVEAKFPKYLSSSQESFAYLTITDDSGTGNTSTGTKILLYGLAIQSEKTIGSAKFRLYSDENDNKVGQFSNQVSLIIRLRPGESTTYKIGALAPSSEDATIVYYIYKYENSLADGEFLNWTSPENACKNHDVVQTAIASFHCDYPYLKNIPLASKNLVCANVNMVQSFRRTAIESLLLPPLSNGLIPIVTYAIIWLVEKLIVGAIAERSAEEDVAIKALTPLNLFLTIKFSLLLICLVVLELIWFVNLRSLSSWQAVVFLTVLALVAMVFVAIIRCWACWIVSRIYDHTEKVLTKRVDYFGQQLGLESSIKPEEREKTKRNLITLVREFNQRHYGRGVVNCLLRNLPQSPEIRRQIQELSNMIKSLGEPPATS